MAAPFAVGSVAATSSDVLKVAQGQQVQLDADTAQRLQNEAVKQASSKLHCLTMSANGHLSSNMAKLADLIRQTPAFQGSEPFIWCPTPKQCLLHAQCMPPTLLDDDQFDHCAASYRLTRSSSLWPTPLKTGPAGA